MTNRDSFDSLNAFATDHVISMSCTPPWSRLHKHACKKRYKYMSLDVCRKAVIAADKSDVKEGGYSLPNEQVE